MLTNTQYFREAALHFQKHGFYCPDPKGTRGYMNYWTRELDRCINGYTVGGTRITGHMYFYLNYVRFKKFVGKGKPKIVGFPDFWDGDYRFFHLFEQAQKEGKHIIAAKARRKGYSLKDAAIATNTYNTVRDSLVILGAHEAKYLYPKGIMTMAVDNMSFLNEHTAWAKRRSELDQQTHKRASYLEKQGGTWVSKGYHSEVMAVTFKDNPDAARGKDANVVILDECGTFDNLKASLAATRPCVETGGVATGIMVLFGTGGDMEGGTIDFESIFYSPEEHGFLAVPNEWDEGAGGTCGFFHPCFLNNENFMDKDGNSLINEAIKAEQAKRDFVKRTMTDPSTYDKLITEYPFTPKEAFLRTGSNMFPVAALNDWRNKLEADSSLANMGTYGGMHRGSDGKATFRPDANARPILKFPHDKTQDISGCTTIYQPPFTQDGAVPTNLYYIQHDPYAGDTEGGQSLGVAYVKKQINNISQPDDMIVASLIGRPSFQDDYNEQLFLLAEYYDCQIVFENDRGEVIPYAKRYRLTKRLHEEFELYDKNNEFRLKKLGRAYGTSMGTGPRKRQAELYLRDWLLRPRGVDENGKQRLNLHTIYDKALLDELIKYDPTSKAANFDRVSACLVGTFAEKDFYNKEVESRKVETKGNFFNRQLFQ